jgi:hypothetical protein
MSCCLYKYKSRPIDVFSIIEQTQFTFILVFTLVFYFLFFHRLDLVSAASTPWVAVVVAYLPSRRRLVGGEAPSSKISDAPD